MLKADNISVEINKNKIVNDVSFELNAGQFFAVTGPNGAGKTMLIRAMMNITPHTGKTFIDGVDSITMTPLDIAKKIAVLSQKYQTLYDFTALDVVLQGRYAKTSGLFTQKSAKDERIALFNMGLTGVEHLKNRSVQTLSGGELQRVFLAQVFTADPQIIILDEPTNHLDLQYQIETFELVKSWLKRGRRAVLAVVHDLNFVSTYADHVLLVKEGKSIAQGKTRDVLTAENLSNVYGLDVYHWMNKLTQHWTNNK